MANGKLIVERSRRITESRYSVGIYIDGEFVVNTIKNNRQEIELPVGKHILKVEQGYRSGEIEIEIKKGKTIFCAFSSSRLIYVTFLLFIIPFLISLQVKNEKELLLYIPFLLVTLYTFTIGRKEYFKFDNPIEDYTYLMNEES